MLGRAALLIGQVAVLPNQTREKQAVGVLRNS